MLWRRGKSLPFDKSRVKYAWDTDCPVKVKAGAVTYYFWGLLDNVWYMSHASSVQLCTRLWISDPNHKYIECVVSIADYLEVIKKVKVKQSCYRPGVAQTVPGSLGSQISWQRHRMVVRLSALRTGRLYPRKDTWYSFLLEAESTPGP